MIKASLLTALAVVSFAQVANASTIDVLLGDMNTDAYGYTSSSAALNPNISLTGNPNLSMNNAEILGAGVSDPGNAAAPSGSVYGGNYLAVLGGGNATFSLASNGNSFGLTWGSIDSYNNLIVTDTRGISYSITGAEILSYLSTTSNTTGQSDVQINDPFGRIVSITLTGNQNSFEAANFSGSAVPLPASSVLFAMGLAGLAFFGWQRKQQKSSI